MKKHFLYSLGLLISLLTLSSFTDGPDNTNTYINGHEYVDLGLSVKWATCNVGASKPEESGGYYAWGETEEKDDYGWWDTYKWCEGDECSMTKYCIDSYYGKIDNKMVLAPEDDVAHVKWGGTWRMPTKAEMQELLDKCEWQWTNRRGVYGYRVFGPNGNSIFLPAAGFRYCTDLYDTGYNGYYWSSSLYEGYSNGAYYWCFTRDGYEWAYFNNRYLGHSVRPVSK